MVKSAKPPKLSIVPDQTAPKPRPAAKAPPATNLADQETYHYHKGIIIQMQARKDAAAKLVKQARRAAQDAGLTLEDLDFITKMREAEPETVKARISRIAKYAEWEGLAPGIQGDLFKHTPKVDEFEAAEHEGYIEGLEGRTAEGERYDTTNALGQSRLSGWHRGQKVIQDRFVSKSEAAKPE